MSVPHENLTKCTLSVQRSHQALIDYHTILFPAHFIHQTKHTRERETERERVDVIMKVQVITKLIFYERKTKYL